MRSPLETPPRATIAALTIALTLIGCDQSTPPAPNGAKGQGGAATNTAAASLPQGLLLTAAPADPTPVTKLRQSAKEGDDVVVRVVVGGREKPFVQNRAIMTVVDAGMANQCLLPSDHCQTPWDYCCEAPEELKPNMATVQVVDERGRPLQLDLTAAAPAVKPGSTVIVQGSVGPRPDPGALVINAKGIFVEPSK